MTPKEMVPGTFVTIGGAAFLVKSRRYDYKSKSWEVTVTPAPV